MKNYIPTFGPISILIIAQRDAIQSSLFIILQVHSTCFGCQPHPSSGVHKTVTTASGTGHISVQLPPSNVAKNALCCISLDSYYYISAMHETINIKFKKPLFV